MGSGRTPYLRTSTGLSSMLKVVCWLWKPRQGYRSQFDAGYVNTFRSMVERHYPDPHEVVCITDMPDGIDPRVRIVPLWDTYRFLPSPHGGLQPACYVRLRAFADDMRDLIGPRYVSVDLDVVITGDLRPVWNRPEPFVIWESRIWNTHYNGSMWMMDAGVHPEVFHDFDPLTSPKAAKRKRYLGSDQAWISYKLGPGKPTWSQRDGIYSFRALKPKNFALPDDARMVFFPGNLDPRHAHTVKMAPWILEYYR